MFIKRISILLAMIFIVLFVFSFGAVPSSEKYYGFMLYESDFMIAARWYFLWLGLSIIALLFYLKFQMKK
jgi:hypothetical protein